MQGKGVLAQGVVYSNRITPACAGKRLLSAAEQLNSKDHPCVCREKFTSKWLAYIV